MNKALSLLTTIAVVLVLGLDLAQAVEERENGQDQWKVESHLAPIHRRATADAPIGTHSVSPPEVNVGEFFDVTITLDGAGGEESRKLPIDVVFAIDSSGSMSSNDPSNLRLEAAKQFLDQLDSQTDAGAIVSWDSNIDFTFPASGLTSEFDVLKTEIDKVDAGGGTNLNVGLNQAIAVLDSNTRPDNSAEVIIFLTDGGGTYTDAANNGPASVAATNGYIIYSIGLGDNADLNPLVDMADATGGQSFPNVSPENVDAIFMDILTEVLESTIPIEIDVITQTESYIEVDEASIVPPATSVLVNPDGTTTIEWLDIDVGAGLPSGESRIFMYMARSTLLGENLEFGTTVINYTCRDMGSIDTVDAVNLAIISVVEEPEPEGKGEGKGYYKKGKGKGKGHRGKGGSGKKGMGLGDKKGKGYRGKGKGANGRFIDFGW